MMSSPTSRLIEAAMEPLPRQTDLPLWRGQSKTVPEDFIVEELPAYEPSGEGDHLFLWLEKRDVPAMAVAPRLARALGVAAKDIGMAGMKDARAITRQYVSVPAAAQDALAGGALDGAPGLRVLHSKRHGNKLKTGHQRGNRFALRIRNAGPMEMGAASLQGAARLQSFTALVAAVDRLGLVNAFGQQRFGHQGHTLRLGCALLGLEGAGAAPRLAAKTLRLALSAVQSALFNLYLQDRLRAGTLHRLKVGDVALVCKSQGPFVVDDVTQAEVRRQQRDIVLGGPLYGNKMLPAAGAPGEHERALLDRFGLQDHHFARFRKLTAGTRRPAVIWPGPIDVAHEAHDEVVLKFCLPSGSYATELLAALFAGGPPAATGEAAPEAAATAS